MAATTVVRNRRQARYRDAVAEILAAAPRPSTWTPEQASDLQRLFVPLVRAGREEADDG